MWNFQKKRSLVFEPFFMLRLSTFIRKYIVEYSVAVLSDMSFPLEIMWKMLIKT